MYLISKIPPKVTQAEPILFIHGAWHNSWYWDVQFMDYFASQGYATYALDLSNHGKNLKSKPLNRNSFKDYVADVREAVEKIGGEPILIGHSMGGGIIQKYLEKYPAKVVVTLGSLPISGALMPTLKYLKIFPWDLLVGSLTLNLHRLVRTNKQAQWAFYETNISNEDLTRYTNLLHSESFLAFLEMLFFKVKINHHRNAAMLVLAGEKDNIFSVQSEEKTAAYYGADYKMIKNAPHNLMLASQWQETADEILSWLSAKG